MDVELTLYGSHGIRGLSWRHNPFKCGFEKSKT